MTDLNVVSEEDTMAATYDKIMGEDSPPEQIPANDAPEEEASEVAETPTVEEPESTPEEEPVDPPASWTAEAKEKFAQLSPELQKFVSEREAQREKFVNQKATELAELKKASSGFEQVTAKYGQYFNQLRVAPEVAFDTLVQAEYTLRNGSIQEKMGMLENLARDYGIPLQAMSQGDVNPIVNQLSQELQSVKTQLSAFESDREAAQREQNLQTINNFASAKDDKGNLLHPYFEDLKPTIARLLQSDLAPSLEEAYKQALKLDETVSLKLQAEEKKRQEKIAAEKAKKARTEAPYKSRALPKDMTAKTETEEDTMKRVYEQLAG